MIATILETLVANPVVIALGWTLFHFAWQAAIIAVVVAVLLLTTHRSSAQLRYVISCAGLLLMLAMPLSTMGYLYANSSAPALNEMSLKQDTAPAGLDLENPNPIATNQSDVAQADPNNNDLIPGSTGSYSASTPLITSSRGWVQSFSSGLQSWLPCFVAIWIAGVLLLAIRLLLGMQRIYRWRRDGLQVADQRLNQCFEQLVSKMKIHNVRLLESVQATVPAVIGWIKPAVLVPSSMITGMTINELESVLAHELAHIRRHDFLVNMIQTTIEIILFYHPAVWWISARIRIERENCCDDIAIATCGSRVGFAKALAKMEEFRCQERLLVAANGGSLVERIRRITSAHPSDSQSWLPAGFMAICAVGLVVCVTTISIANANVSSIPTRLHHPINFENLLLDKSATTSEDENLNNNSDDDKYPTRKLEVKKVDPKTGFTKRVFTDIELTTLSGDKKQKASLDMLYSNVMMYSFIPARIAKELGAVELGEIDFGETAPARPKRFQTIYDPAAEKKAMEAKAIAAAKKAAAKIKEIHVRDLLEPRANTKVVPYPNDGFWIPAHLGFYGVNKSKQHLFKIVRIESVDLGIGPSFGPVNALVLDDDNSSFGVLGSNWTRKVRGNKGETLWHLAADGSFRLMARKKPAAKQPSQPAKNPNQQGMIKVESSGRNTVDPDAARSADVTVLKSHTYNSSRRESTGWIELKGAKVPVDQAVEHDGIAVHMSLFLDTIAIDAKTKKVLWDIDWGKTQPFWQTVSIVEFQQNGEKMTAVELFASNKKTGELIYRYYDIKTGAKLDPNARQNVWNAGARVPIAIAGSFDFDDGENMQSVLDAIQANGGTIAARYDKTGKVHGAINAQTRYLVLGNPPNEDNPGLRKAYRLLFAQAKTHSVQVITLDKLKKWMGKMGPAKVQGLTITDTPRNPIPVQTLEAPNIKPVPNSNENHPNIHVAKRDGDTITQAYTQATGRKRSPAELLKHFSESMDLADSIEAGEMLVGMNTLVSANPRYLLGIGMDADQVTFFLPKGTGTHAIYSGKNIEIKKGNKSVQITITHGSLKLLDANGVTRATASADGGAEQLIVTTGHHHDGIELVMKTQRLVEDKNFPNPPVQVRFNTETGADKNETDPPHGAVRFAIHPEDKSKKKPAEMKLVRHYNLKRLADDAEKQTGKTWQEMIKKGDREHQAGQDRKLLERHWIHSREEEAQDGIEVYRPEGTKIFPPSRFRMQFILKAGGACSYYYLSPNDRHHFRDGSWQLIGDMLQIDRGDAKINYKIVELTKDVLRLKRINE